MQKRGLSGLVTTVLLVLVALAATGIVWAALKPTVIDSGERIKSQVSCFDVNVEVKSCRVISASDEAEIIVRLKRGNVVGFAGLVEFDDGTTARNDSNRSIDVLSTEKLYVSLDGKTPERASVAAIIRGGSGNELCGIKGDVDCVIEACSTDSDCDDGLFCNGDETCDVGTGVCGPGTDPCSLGQICNEIGELCNDIDPPNPLAIYAIGQCVRAGILGNENLPCPNGPHVGFVSNVLVQGTTPVVGDYVYTDNPIIAEKRCTAITDVQIGAQVTIEWGPEMSNLGNHPNNINIYDDETDCLIQCQDIDGGTNC